MGKVSSLVKIAVTAGPAVWEAVRRMGPMLTRMREENPEIYNLVSQQVTRMASARQENRGEEGLRRRIGVLRDQVAYLIASADDDAESRRAEDWRRQLDKIEASLPLLGAMSRHAAAKEAKHVDERIDALSAQILSAYVDEQREDHQLEP
ncbi:hypothetical protein [Georgenia thermotolerans]|uniref:Uncharacterized protein n=1 Tax=Georgenia thermotolerans TaxID=527326 RepID=A0A7J5UR30_9MICO|nr:hypothetical protein [Georgenia thermotolerans]KAE8764671.1 hypothetical protein GB883_07610 [Georgenia thermotolerans]